MSEIRAEHSVIFFLLSLDAVQVRLSEYTQRQGSDAIDAIDDSECGRGGGVLRMVLPLSPRSIIILTIVTIF